MADLTGGVKIFKLRVDDMINRHGKTSIKAVAALAGLGVLTGCSAGGYTYGTGVSQEQQLVSDLTSMVALGTSEKKKPIDYSSRPTLVPPPKTAELPSPAERVDQESAYFPQNPEERRQDLARSVEEAEANGTALPEEIVAARRASAENGKRIARRKPVTAASTNSEAWEEISPAEQRRQRAEFLKRKAEVSGTRGAAPRKYLTEPPKEYRTPASTAPIGETGERETINKKKNKSLFGSLGELLGTSKKKSTKTASKTTKKAEAKTN